MMAKKGRFPPGYSATFAPQYESEASYDFGHVDTTEDSSALMRKWIDVNSATRYGLAVPMQTIPLSKLALPEKKRLVHRLTSELQKIRLLQNKIDSEMKLTVNAVAKPSRNALNSNAGQQRRQEMETVKKASGLDSDPGQNPRGSNRGLTGKSAIPNMQVFANAGIIKQCESLLKKLMSQQHGWVFNTPVDAVKLNIPDYLDVIKKPMDLGTIKGKLTSEKYSSPLEFLEDVRLTFANAKTYNPPGHAVHNMAETMSQFFEIRWKAIEKKIATGPCKVLPKTSGTLEETERTNQLLQLKKRKLSPIRKDVIQERIKRKMTDDEKHRMSSELVDVLGDQPDSIIEFLKAQTSNGDDGEDTEIVIDIDDLSDDTLFTLRKLIDDHLIEKRKNTVKSEVCEIELPNVSGLSNSSLHGDKGSEPIDQDVDIGDNEVQVSSYPPVLIDKSASKKADECNEQASINGLDHLEQSLQSQTCTSNLDGTLDGKNLELERQVSPDKLYRAALLKNRFADTILKAREKTLPQNEKADPEKLRREREELEVQKKIEKARLQAEARAAEDARKRAEAAAAAEAAAEARRQRELEREAAREALLKMEKTVEINENSRFLEDLEMLRVVAPEQLPSFVEETSPDHSQDVFGKFNFGNNPLEQLGLYMKVDEEEEEGEPPSKPNVLVDAEEGEID